ncbi:MAG: sugar phosphate isomerase/epimerase [Flavitalea sp.]
MKRFSWVCYVALISLAFTRCNDAPKNPEAADTSATDSSFSIADNWKIGVQMWTFRLFSFTDALQKVDSAGVKSIEAFWGQPLGGDMKDSFGISMSPESKAKIKQLLQSKGISIVAMGVISPSTTGDWLKAFELAKEFNLSYITAEPRREHWDFVDSVAGVYGIKIAIHDHPKPSKFWHPDSVLAAAAGHPNIGACADIGHWPRSGLDPVECLKKLEGHVYGAHLKDIKTFDNTEAEDTIVGKGVIDYPAVFRELKRQKFKGMLSIEHESNWYHNLPDVIEIIQYYNKQVADLK